MTTRARIPAGRREPIGAATVAVRCLATLQHLGELCALGAWAGGTWARRVHGDLLSPFGTNSSPACQTASPPTCTLDQRVQAQALVAARVDLAATVAAVGLVVAITCLLVRLWLHRSPTPPWVGPAAAMGTAVSTGVLLDRLRRSLAMGLEGGEESQRVLARISLHLALYAVVATAAWAVHAWRTRPRGVVDPCGGGETAGATGEGAIR